MKKTAKSKPFEAWLISEVEEVFHLSHVEMHPMLEQWLIEGNSDAVSISLYEQQTLDFLQRKLRQNVDIWNEEELKMAFIGPVLSLVDFYEGRYNLFFERKLTAKVDNITLNGVVDCLIASGKQIPGRPYFCLQEYKPKKYDNDPIGQLLISMVCAQAKNENPAQPIYGVLVEYRFWYFAVLHGREYTLCEPFAATRDEDLPRIFKILKQLKLLIEPWLTPQR